MTHDRLSPLDASFLYLESPTTPMHISSLTIYEGPTLPDAELRENFEQRLHLIPRFRQIPAPVPFGAHRPVWQDDPYFDLDGHLNRISLPAPGTEAQLQELCGRLLGIPLDRTKPLWDMWVVDGLEDGRFAILSRTHHTMWDGVSGADIHAVLLDPTPEPQPIEPEPWEPSLPAGAGVLMTQALSERVRESVGLLRGALRAARDPRRALRETTGVARGGLELARSVVRPAPRSGLNGRTGSRRRFTWTRASLADVKLVKDTFETKLNDVVLATVAGALERWLAHRASERLPLRAMVPVSLRDTGERTFGNQVAMLHVTLPVEEHDPVRRLLEVRERMLAEKGSNQIHAGRVLLRMAEAAPPMVVAAVTRTQAVQRAFNLLVTNIPGPPVPLYLRGRRLLDLIPQAPLAANQGLAVAVMSYDDRLDFGLLADRDLVPDLDVIASGIERSLEELVEAAKQAGDDHPIIRQRDVRPEPAPANVPR